MISQIPPGFQEFISQRQQLMDATNDPALKQHYQAEINVARLSLQPGDIDNVPNVPKGPPSTGNVTLAGPPPGPGGPPSVHSSVLTANGPGSPDSTDSNEKLAYLKPLFDDASNKSGVPSDVLAALVLGEGRGVSINNLSSSGLAQCGEAEFNEERQRHPDAFPPDVTWNSPKGQILAAAFRLADNHRPGDPNWDNAAALYNGGENAGGHLNDPNYLNKFHQFLDAIRSGGSLPS